MTTQDLALIYKGLAHILSNQVKIMQRVGVDNFYAIEDTSELAVLFGELSEACYKEKDV